MHPVTAEVTERIVQRSRDSRAAYLADMAAARDSGPGRGKLSCANWAHAFAASPEGDKQRLRDPSAPNVAIVSAYNDMLSAHQPLGAIPRSSSAPPMRPEGPPSTPAGCRRCATESPKAGRGWSCRCSAAT